MKTEEFIKEIKRMNLIAVDQPYCIEVERKYIFGKVAQVQKYGVGSLWFNTNDLELVKLCIEYAETPIAEREKVKKYTLILPDPEYVGILRIALQRMLDGAIVLVLTHEREVKGTKYFHLTEAEIKRNHEYLWQFAKEVE